VRPARVSAVFASRIAFRMANMEVNKAFAAVLSAGIAFMITGLVGQRLVHVERPHESAIQIGDVAAAQPTQAPAAAAPPLEPITPLLASANVQNGQALAQRLCASCHSFNGAVGTASGPTSTASSARRTGRQTGSATRQR
jgi:cytochrome c